MTKHVDDDEEPPTLTPEMVREVLEHGAKSACELKKLLEPAFRLRPEQRGLVLR